MKRCTPFHRTRRLLVLPFWLLILASLRAQIRTITGSVTASDGETADRYHRFPLPKWWFGREHWLN